jgi:transcriptional regulator GlxA family with amidase domain
MKKLITSIFLLNVLIVVLSGSAAASTIGILVFDGFLTSDVTAPIEVFGTAVKKPAFSNWKVSVISATSEKNVVSEEGLRIVADKTIYDDMRLDVLIVPSAYRMDRMLKDKNLINFIQKQRTSASWMGSNCAGAFLLSQAGILDGKHATTWAGGEKQLADSNPRIKVEYDQNVVIDDKVITSNGGPVSYQAAFELLARLSSVKFADEIAKSIQYTRLKSAFK